MKTILLGSICLLMLAALAVLAAPELDRTERAGSSPRPGPPSIDLIRERAELIALETDLSCVVNAGLTGYTGDVRALVIAHGHATFAADLTEPKWQSVDHDNKTATLSLPPPRPRRVAIDHDRSEVWSIDRRGLWFILPRDCREGEVVIHALRSAEQTMHDTAKSDTNLHAQARRHADEVIAGLYADLGWIVEVAWRDPAGE